ncbi:MAG TPA: hypothetical protein DIW36_08570 [Ruminococcaceae bacterium]|nr:hypothetical protein [Oscillospiraceae bacterium]
MKPDTERNDTAMKEEVLFKKTPFGGFDRESVINYIQQLKKAQLEYKNIISDKDRLVKNLSEENSELKTRAERAESDAAELRKKFDEAEDNAKRLRAKCEMLEKQAEESADKKAAQETIERCDKLVESAEAAAAKLRKGAQSQIKRSAKKLEKVKDDPEKAKKIIQQLIEELS